MAKAEPNTGLAIGGPMAGQMLASPGRTIQVVQTEPTTLKERLEASVGETRTHTADYIWQHIGPFALWLYTGYDLRKALTEMALAYQEKHNGKD